jgi:SET domain-containing protein
MQVKLALGVKKSRIDGKGLFTLAPIPVRRKIGELSGERISQREARRRARKAECIVIVELGDGMAIDGLRGGNEFRFINHSCSPNIFMRIYHGHVEFYALRDIHCGEELTRNYGESHHSGQRRCTCGSAKCRGYI